MGWVDTCQVWRDGGELVARVRAGDVDGLKNYAAPRRR
jgi:hypothetical protein